MLSLRLKTIENLVEHGKIIADIGTDHALLPVELVLSGKVKKAYAVDNKNGPFLRAQQYIKASGCETLIEATLSDGLSSVAEDADCWIIAGMGYETATQILDQRPQVQANQQLIIQINHGVDDLRKYLMNNKWQIIDERIVYDAHYYQIIKAIRVDSVVRLRTEDIEYGPMLRKEKSSVFTEYWQFQMQKLKKIVNQLDRGSKRAQQLQKQINSIKNMLNG